MPTAKTDTVLTPRQQAIGERLERFLERPGMRDFMRREVELWTTLKQPPNPFPVDKNHGRNSDNEDAVLLAAAYQCFSPNGESILPAWFDQEEYPTRLRWCVLIELVGRLEPNYLSYIHETLAGFTAKHPPADESTLSERQQHILQAMLEMKAFNSDSRCTIQNIAAKAEGIEANPENFKQPIAALVKMKLVQTKASRGGGCWLTNAGNARADKLASQTK